MDRELLPAATHVSAEPARLVPRVLCRFVSAILHQFPESSDLPVALALFSLILGGTLFRLWLRHLVLANEMLHEIVFPITCVAAIGHRAGPPLQLPVPLTLVSDPIRFTLEGLGFIAALKCASKRLYIFVHMFGPVRRLLETLDLETERTLEFGGRRCTGGRGTPGGN